MYTHTRGEYMKMIYMDCGLRNKYESDIHSNENYLSGSEKKAVKKKIQACTGPLQGF